MKTIKFEHGLGDCCNFLRLQSLLQRVSQHPVPVQLPSNYQPLCKYFGIPYEQVGDEVEVEPWVEPAYHEDNPVLSNKVLSKIPDDVDKELFFTPLSLPLHRPTKNDVSKEVARYVEELKKKHRYFIVVQACGNSYKDRKRIEPEQLKTFVDTLVKEFDATVFINDLQGEYRSFDEELKYSNYVVRSEHVFTIEEFLYLLLHATLVIGVDSGTLHLARSFGIPTIGLFEKISPVMYSVPDKNTLSLIIGDTYAKEYDRFNYVFRLGYTPSLNHRKTTDLLRRVLDKQDALIADYLSNIKHFSSTFQSREPLFEFLLANSKNILELGSTRQFRDFSAGYSTYLFAMIAAMKEGKLRTIDLNTSIASKILEQFKLVDVDVEAIEGNTLEVLPSIDDMQCFDTIYIDTVDATEPYAPDHALLEYQLVCDRFNGWIIVDDTFHDGNTCRGKGAKIFKVARSHSKRVLFLGQNLVIQNRIGQSL